MGLYGPLVAIVSFSPAFLPASPSLPSPLSLPPSLSVQTSPLFRSSKGLRSPQAATIDVSVISLLPSLSVSPVLPLSLSLAFFTMSVRAQYRMVRGCTESYHQLTSMISGSSTVNLVLESIYLYHLFVNRYMCDFVFYHVYDHDGSCTW